MPYNIILSDFVNESKIYLKVLNQQYYDMYRNKVKWYVY